MYRAGSTLLFCHSIPITPQRSPVTLKDASHPLQPICSNCPMGGDGRGTFETRLTAFSTQPSSHSGLLQHLYYTHACGLW